MIEHASGDERVRVQIDQLHTGSVAVGRVAAERNQNEPPHPQYVERFLIPVRLTQE
jgi:hypothetical protein